MRRLLRGVMLPLLILAPPNVSLTAQVGAGPKANAPPGTESFVLSVRDLDMPATRNTDDQTPHWIVWNIPATESGLPEGVPKGPRLANGAFQISATGPMYRGPGAAATGPRHHYVFELFALKAPIFRRLDG